MWLIYRDHVVSSPLWQFPLLMAVDSSCIRRDRRISRYREVSKKHCNSDWQSTVQWDSVLELFALPVLQVPVRRLCVRWTICSAVHARVWLRHLCSHSTPQPLSPHHQAAEPEGSQGLPLVSAGETKSSPVSWDHSLAHTDRSVL